jgi:ATP-binding cassette subfamily B protein
MGRPETIHKSVPRLTAVLLHFWPWIRTERRLIVFSMGALFAGVLFRLAEPWPLKFVLDRIVAVDPGIAPALRGLSSVQLLTAAAFSVVAITGLRAFCDYRQRLGFAKIGNRVLRRVRDHVFTHLHGLSLAFHTKARTGDLLIRVTRDVSLLRDVTSTSILPMLASVLVLAGMLTVSLFVEWRLALVAILPAPFFLLSTTRLGRGIHQAARKQRKREGAMAATAAESITAIREVQALSLEGEFAQSFGRKNAESQQQDLKAARLSAKLGRTVDVLGAVATALVLWYGALLVTRGRMTPGDLIVFLAYLKRAFKPARDFAKHTGRLAKAVASGERVLGILERKPEVADRRGAVPAPRFAGAVELRDVEFGYGDDAPVLSGVSLNARPGEFVVITGPSGGGKSTLVSLLLRLYDPRQGSVRIDGRDTREFTLASLRSQIGIVLQDTQLFVGTVGDNIALGCSDRSPDEIEAAARTANADAFIRALPDGYETIVGERGATLSRGQRQRIAIARAVLRRTPILLLDEPTTGLDSRSEASVTEAITRLPGEMTRIVVTHDLRVAEAADLVLYLDHGKVVEAGAPEDLKRAGGRYAALHRMQTQWGIQSV